MQERPILFSTPMVKAILEGRKTQTRRDRGLKSINDYPDRWEKLEALYIDGRGRLCLDFYTEKGDLFTAVCPYGKVGDVLWVREAWSINPFYRQMEDMPENLYKASDKPFENHKWKPSIHMPKSACRLWLEITDIRVERLQEISEEDCIAEGIQYIVTDMIRGYKDYDNHSKEITESIVDTPRESYRSLWQSINGEESWTLNPWVWVINFQQIQKPHHETNL